VEDSADKPAGDVETLEAADHDLDRHGKMPGSDAPFRKA
jgi:hypothetical protein